MSRVLDELKLTRYKGFADFTVKFSKQNILVGPNNAGKSTIIGALRLCSVALGHATRRNPTDGFIDGGRSIVGFPLAAISTRDLPGFSFENINHEFHDREDTRIRLRFKSGGSLNIIWPTDGIPFFYVERLDGLLANQIKLVHQVAPTIGIVPGLSPIDQHEEVLSEKYVAESITSRRASSHFRNQLYHIDQDAYDKFIEFALEHTPEISALRLDTDYECSPPEHDLFFVEVPGKSEKELFWAGDGLHIWLQILFHVFRNLDRDVIVLDEPDIYLHPDLQRRMVFLLEEISAQTLVATHAPEVLTEAARDSIVWVDRTRKNARRARDERFIDQLNAHLGSGFNLGLARALRSKLALFVEGNDMKILRNMARTVGAKLFHKERGITVIPLEGFTNWANVKPFSWMAKEMLGETVKIGVLLDRDYRSESASREVVSELAKIGVIGHVWKRKELESYLIVPGAISRLSNLSIEMVEAFLEEEAEALRFKVQANFVHERQAELVTGKSHAVAVAEAALPEFEREWIENGRKLEMVPAKELLSKLNERVRSAGGKTMSARALSHAIRPSEHDREVREFLLSMEEQLKILT